jgi:hypothetical protein
MLKEIFTFLKNLWDSISNDNKRGDLLKPSHLVASNTSIQQRSIDTKKVPNVVSKKKFTIKPTGKNFIFRETTNISPPPSSSKSGKLKGIIQTRPKKCLYCRTEDKITLTSEKKWKCKVCEYEWQ